MKREASYKRSSTDLVANISSVLKGSFAFSTGGSTLGSLNAVNAGTLAIIEQMFLADDFASEILDSKECVARRGFKTCIVQMHHGTKGEDALAQFGD